MSSKRKTKTPSRKKKALQQIMLRSSLVCARVCTTTHTEHNLLLLPDALLGVQLSLERGRAGVCSGKNSTTTQIGSFRVKSQENHQPMFSFPIPPPHTHTHIHQTRRAADCFNGGVRSDKKDRGTMMRMLMMMMHVDLLPEGGFG